MPRPAFASATLIFLNHPIRRGRHIAPMTHILKFTEVERFNVAIGHGGNGVIIPTWVNITEL